jgi:hypothetical protein
VKYTWSEIDSILGLTPSREPVPEKKEKPPEKRGPKTKTRDQRTARGRRGR